MATIYQVAGKETFRYQHKLMDLASNVHMTLNGSLAGFSKDQIIFFAEFLKARLQDWQDPTSDYDEAVRAVCRVTLKEYNNKLERL